MPRDEHTFSDGEIMLHVGAPSGKQGFFSIVPAGARSGLRSANQTLPYLDGPKPAFLRRKRGAKTLFMDGNCAAFSKKPACRFRKQDQSGAVTCPDWHPGMYRVWGVGE